MARTPVDSKLKRPARLTIRGVRITVAWLPAAECVDHEGDHFFGRTTMEKSLIEMNMELTEEHAFAVLFHEIGHVLFYMTGKTPGSNTSEEEFCDALGFGAASILLENTKLVDWLRAIKKSK